MRIVGIGTRIEEKPVAEMTSIGGHLLLDNKQGAAHLCAGVVHVRNGLIDQVDLSAKPESAEIGGKDCFVAPGLIDLHLHLPQFDLIGAHGLPLLDWLEKIVFPAEAKWQDAEYARGMTKRVARQLLSVGTTSIAAYATSNYAATLAAIEILQQFAIRGCVGLVGMDRLAPTELLRPADQFADETAKLIERFLGTCIEAAITPRFAITCSETLLASAGKLASQTGAVVQTHLAETQLECDEVSRLFDGRSYVDVYKQAELLTPKTIFGHGIHLNALDRSELAQSKSMIAHCPTANTFLRSGQMDRSRLVQSGVNIVLGSDIGAGYERSMVRVARAMIETASLIGDQYPSAAQAWYAITAGAADRMGWNDVGRLREGSKASLIVVQPDIPWIIDQVDSLNGLDPLSQLMFAWDDRWIKQVHIGDRVYRLVDLTR
jgi:guanine deaminase